MVFKVINNDLSPLFNIFVIEINEVGNLALGISSIQIRVVVNVLIKLVKGFISNIVR